MGNAVTDDYHDYVGTFEYWWTHGLISDSTYRILRVACDFGSSQHPSLDCMKALNVAQLEQGRIDPYSIYTRPCNNTQSLKRKLKGHYVSSHQFLYFTYLDNGNFGIVFVEIYMCIIYDIQIKRICRFFPLKNKIIVFTLIGLERNLDLDLLDLLST